LKSDATTKTTGRMSSDIGSVPKMHHTIINIMYAVKTPYVITMYTVQLMSHYVCTGTNFGIS